MWHTFLAWPKVVSLFGVVVVAVLGWAKRKAISQASAAGLDWVQSNFFGWFGKKILEASPPTAPTPTQAHYERTYRGVYRGWIFRSGPLRENFIQVVDDKGTIVTVPVMATEALHDVKQGDFVEIDTLVGANYYAEIVKRVRVLTTESAVETKAKPKPKL